LRGGGKGLVGEERASDGSGNRSGGAFYEEVMGGGGGENVLVEEAFGYVIGGADEEEPGFGDGSESEKRLWRQPGEDFENQVLREIGRHGAAPLPPKWHDSLRLYEMFPWNIYFFGKITVNLILNFNMKVIPLKF
jgi:hypothetical protein